MKRVPEKGKLKYRYKHKIYIHKSREICAHVEEGYGLPRPPNCRRQANLTVTNHHLSTRVPSSYRLSSLLLCCAPMYRVLFLLPGSSKKRIRLGTLIERVYSTNFACELDFRSKVPRVLDRVAYLVEPFLRFARLLSP